jgi:hypothetical protein
LIEAASAKGDGGPAQYRVISFPYSSLLRVIATKCRRITKCLMN